MSIESRVFIAACGFIGLFGLVVGIVYGEARAVCYGLAFLMASGVYAAWGEPPQLPPLGH